MVDIFTRKYLIEAPPRKSTAGKVFALFEADLDSMSSIPYDRSNLKPHICMYKTHTYIFMYINIYLIEDNGSYF